MTIDGRVHPPEGIDLSTDEFWARPLAQRSADFARLRALGQPALFTDPQTPFTTPDQGYYALVSHADITAASRHPELFSSARGSTSIVDLPVEFNEYFGSMINMDDPRHARLRRIVSRAFTPKMIKRFEENVQRTAAAIVDDLIETGPCDFVEHVSARLPLKIICEMMGIGDEHYAMVLRNTNIILSGSDTEFVSQNMDEAIGQILTAGQDLANLVTGLAAERQEAPADDLTTALATANIDGEQLTPAELASFFVLLVVAGNETTRTAISHALNLLTEHPDQRELLLADLEGRIGGAVEEIVRYVSPVIWMRRSVTARLHAEWPRIPRGRQDGAVLLGGQSGRVGVRRAGPFRHHPLPQSARRLRRRGTALLPGRAPGPPGDHGDAARAAEPGPARARRGRAGPAAVELHQWHQAPALRPRLAARRPLSRPYRALRSSAPDLNVVTRCNHCCTACITRDPRGASGPGQAGRGVNGGAWLRGDPRVAEGDLRPGKCESLAGPPGRATLWPAPERRACRTRDATSGGGIFVLWAAPPGGVAPPAGEGGPPRPAGRRPQARRLICPASAKSAPVRPPAECVDRVSVTLFQEIAMSG